MSEWNGSKIDVGFRRRDSAYDRTADLAQSALDLVASCVAVGAWGTEDGAYRGKRMERQTFFSTSFWEIGERK